MLKRNLKRKLSLLLVITIVFSLSLVYNMPQAKAAPATMPIISRNVPVYALHNQIDASKANDADYGTWWRSNAQSGGDCVPTWLAYDLSGVPTNQRQTVLVAWYNDTAWDVEGRLGTSLPKDYTVEVNSAAGGGGSAPTSGWVVKATVTGNTLASRQHLIDMAGYNWVRLNFTHSFGDGGPSCDIIVQADIHNASGGASDDWLFIGDSITAGGMDIKMKNGVGNFSQLINAQNPAYTPSQIDAGMGGWQSIDPLLNCPSGIRWLDKWIAAFPGKYVTYNMGTNDAGWAIEPATYKDHMKNAIDTIIAAGKTPVIAKIPWNKSAGTVDRIPGYNAKIDELYSEYGSALVQGPDLWTFLQNNPSYISSDNLHPNEAGYAAIRQQWAAKMTTDVYGGVYTSPTPTPTGTPTPTPPPQGPYGTAFPIPCTIQAENYDVGGEGYACHDSDTTNQGGQYRTSDGVDIEACGEGGYSIGYSATGEWLEYTVNVASAGTYNVNARVASATGNKTMHIEFDGVNKTGTMTVPNTGGWQTWQTITASGVALSAGTQVMRIYFETAEINLNYVDITTSGATATPTPTAAATATPTPTPTAGATATPTPTPTAGATATPTPTPTPSPTPTPTPTSGATPTPTPTPTPTATPTPTPTTTPTAGANLALNKAVTVSSLENQGAYPASAAVDGNTTTRWASEFSDPQWIYVDLGASYSVNRVILNWETAYATAYKVQVSSDASNWTDVYSTTTGTGGVATITFTAVSARYVRMYGTQRVTSFGYSLYEFEVYN